MKPQRTTHERKEDDIYDYEYRLKSGLVLLDRTTTIASEDRALIKDFLTHLKANGVLTGRLTKYLFHLKNLGAHLGITFREANRADIERLVHPPENGFSQEILVYRNKKRFFTLHTKK